MNPILVEVIGIIATLLILFSMLFKTTTLKGDIRMRILNLIGSLIFTVYGCLIPAISTAILNSALIIVNSYHLIMLLKEKKKQKTDEQQ
jgi:predicted membrane protein